jgi:hypothetical protein
MPWVGFEPTIPAFERAKTVHALDRAATVIGVITLYGAWISLNTNKVEFEVLTAVIMKSYISWDITPHSPLKIDGKIRSNTLPPSSVSSKALLATCFMLVSCLACSLSHFCRLVAYIYIYTHTQVQLKEMQMLRGLSWDEESWLSNPSLWIFYDKRTLSTLYLVVDCNCINCSWLLSYLFAYIHGDC